jgi:anthranilate phosphoribosyltransferase
MALRVRGETVDEITGAVRVMRARALHVQAPEGAIDIVGTGGDSAGTFNISTGAALVVAGCGVPVAKHGNRAVTSQSGSADVLDALGVRIDHDAASAGEALRTLGFAFLFAPNFHPAMKHAGPTRREIGVRTAFNLLGPLTNPAGAKRQVVGVGDPAAAPRLAEVLRLVGVERAFVEEVVRHEIDARKLGLASAPTSRLAGGDPAHNARLVEAVLHGESGARRDVVLLNASAALLAAGRVGQLEEGLEVAALAIDAGQATELLARLRDERRAAEAARPTAGAAGARA